MFTHCLHLGELTQFAACLLLVALLALAFLFFNPEDGGSTFD
jgi:hypothetical protein